MTGSHTFDSSAWVGAWPFGAGTHESLDQLVLLLRGIGIDGALVSPIRAVLAPEPTRANRELRGQIIGHSDRGFTLMFSPIVNPSLPGWLDHLSWASDPEHGAADAIRIAPNYHGFSLGDPEVDQLAEAIASRGLPLVVQIRMLDERAHHPLMKVPAVPIATVADLAHRHPDLDIVVAGAFHAEVAAIAEQPRIHVELSSIESDDTLSSVLRILPSERVLLGTHAPLYDPLPGLVKVRDEAVSVEIRAAIAGENARRLFLS